MEKTPSFRVHSFGHYYLLERIAVGGMAEIFKAKQVGVRGFEKIIVIKKILQHLSEDPEFVEMFEDEAKIAARLTQANIVQIYELGEVDGTLYIAMEYIEGKNLRDITRAASGKSLHLTVEQSVMILTEVLKGLDYAHRKSDSDDTPLSIVHRDMSPQNIILSYEGEVKILDFGIAKAASKISKTEAGVLKGKFSYMSPEQASGKIVSQTSDIYACGVILHELLTSERLFRSKTDLETLERVKEGKVYPPSEKNEQIPVELDQIVLKALTKDTSKRYQTAGEMLTDLTRLAYEKKYSFGSQDLAAFMQTLFASEIVEEKQKLLRALADVPATPTQQIQNARTHISFKATPMSEMETFQRSKVEKTATANPRAITHFFAKKPVRIAAAVCALLMIGFFILPKKQDSTHETQMEQLEEVPATQKNSKEINIPLPDKSPAKQSAHVQNILKPTDKDAIEAPVAAPAPKSKKKPTITQTLNENSVREHFPSVPKTTRMGRIDVIAPPTGFAQLYIDGQPRGTVPGPNARAIPLAEGSHAIRCESSSQIYSGFIEIKADEQLFIHCQDLK
ncbi:MAG: serine/threonine protein kinase [Deltaproteobacteria bacterium]|nr:serine/threonine protein kinase [Deltaproteobacteria bacterium]